VPTRSRETTPIQAALNRAGHGTIEIAEPYRDGLAGLDGFGYARVAEGDAEDINRAVRAARQAFETGP